MLTDVMIAFTLLGSGWAALGLVPLYWSPRHRRFARWLAAQWGGTATVVFLLKAAIRKPRPLASPVWGMKPTDFSFPSGHAAGAFVFAAFLGIVVLEGKPGGGRGRPRWRRALAGALLVCAIGVAASRVYLGVHDTLDVVGGALLGTIVGVTCAKRYLHVGPAGSATPPPPLGPAAGDAISTEISKGLAASGGHDPQ